MVVLFYFLGNNFMLYSLTYMSYYGTLEAL